MSEIACITKLPQAPYPPDQYSAADQARLAKLEELRAQAPYGRDPDGRIINELTYRLRQYRKVQELRALHVRWPFWAGVGLGVAAIGVLVARR